MKKNFTKVVTGMLLAAFVLVASSCTTFKAEGLSFMPYSNNMQVLGHFHEGQTVVEMLGQSGGANLFNITSGAMKDKVTGIIWNEISKKGGNAAINVEVTYYVGPIAYFFNVITFNILAPARIVVEGDIVLMDASQATAATNLVIQNAISNASVSNANNKNTAPQSATNNSQRLNLSSYALWGADHGNYNAATQEVTWANAWNGGGMYGVNAAVAGYKNLELHYSNAKSNFQVWVTYSDGTDSAQVEASAKGKKVSIPLDSSKGSINNITIQNKDKNANSVKFDELILTN
ncbi:MAG: hypothetical protein J6J00_01040 [Treponema sp.]|nr:hypothetical protein [Treponema sp.]